MEPTSETIYKVTAPAKGNFRGWEAHAVVMDGRVTRAPPLLRYCKGHPAQWLEQYAELKGWKIIKVPMLRSDPEHG